MLDSLLEKLLLPVRPVVLSVWTMNFWCVGLRRLIVPVQPMMEWNGES